MGLKDANDPRLVPGIAIVRINASQRFGIAKNRDCGNKHLQPHASAHDDALQPLLSRRINNGSSQLIGRSSNHYHQIESAFNLLTD
jgi:hypothetical protein